MILCLDIGNTQIYGGVYEGDQLKLRFRCASDPAKTSDQFGVFLKAVLRENNIDDQSIKNIAMSSVVPSLDYSLRAACMKYFKIEPFILKAGVKTGLKINIKNPLELGADLIAGAIAACFRYPDKNIIIVDFGTATTFSILSKTKIFLGAVILPGMRLSMEALGEKTAKLFPVEIIKPETIIGRSTIESIQAGLYFGQIGMIKEINDRIVKEAFHQENTIIIGTGGFVHMFQKERLFDAVLSDLILEGLLIALKMNSI